MLEGTAPLLVLKHDFPLTPARVELDPKFCLRLPHVEEDGHFCHGREFDGPDIADPVAAVGKVLSTLDEFLANCAAPGWVEAEFQRERQNYWSRQAAGTKSPASYRTSELLLEIDPTVEGPQEAAAVPLSDEGKAFATTLSAEPERVAKARGWPVGGIIRGAALVVKLPLGERWTPSVWPKSFSDLDALLSEVCGTSTKLKSWYSARRWPNKAPVFVVLLHGPAVFGWRVLPAPIARQSEPALAPINVSRVDRQWSLSRDHNADGLGDLSAKKVVVFGCGALGAPVVELLARAGVGTIEVVDSQSFGSENIARHILGVPDVGIGKAAALCARLRRNIPGATLEPFGETAMQWFTKAKQRTQPDLVIDCTGERSVRIGTSMLRKSTLDNAPVMMAWIEPFGAAAHAVLTCGNTEWPVSDPADTAINFAAWPDDVQISLPGCGYGFHPYGATDAWGAAGMVVEKALDVLKSGFNNSGVWSLVRRESYFSSKSPSVTFNRPSPVPSGLESVIQYRPLEEALKSG
jgi:hypothetical protein